jgi:hypothetical protein
MRELLIEDRGKSYNKDTLWGNDEPWADWPSAKSKLFATPFILLCLFGICLLFLCCLPYFAVDYLCHPSRRVF